MFKNVTYRISEMCGKHLYSIVCANLCTSVETSFANSSVEMKIANENCGVLVTLNT